MKYTKKIYIFGLVAVLALVGCSDDALIDSPDFIGSGEYVSFAAGVSTGGALASRSADTPYEPYDPLVLDTDQSEFPVYLHTYEHAIGSEYVDRQPQSRGEQVNDVNDFYRLHQSFGVDALKADGSSYFPMQNTRELTDDHIYWTTNGMIPWPRTERLQFHAIAPYTHLSEVNNPAYTDKKIEFSYTAKKSASGDKDAEAQTDLLMAVASMTLEQAAEYDYHVPLKFNHALSAIKFAVRDIIAGRVVSIAIKGVKGSGKCTYTAAFDSEGGQFVWDTEGVAATSEFNQIFDYTLNSDFPFETVDPNSPEAEDYDIVLTDDMPAKTFMMIPQVIPADARIELTIEQILSDGSTRTITVGGKIGNNVKEWLPGHEYIYTISTSKDNWIYVFDAEGNDAEGRENIYVYAPSDTKFEQYGNNAYFNVISYRYRANDQSVIEPLPWKASHEGSLSYNVDGGGEQAYPAGNPDLKFINSSDWIDDTFATKLSGEGSATKNSKERHDLVFHPHYVTTDWIGDETMQGYAAYSGYSEANPYDLSTFGGTRLRTTANCYVVDRGGWYMFPLVYGNAIKNNITNTSSYQCQSTSTDNRLATLVDYNGNSISGPTISITAQSRAEMVWQDAYGMIDENSIKIVNVGGVNMIRFYVESNNLQQGNAVIALTTGDRPIGQSTVVWSWHIWATEHWLDATSRLPHVYDTNNSTFNTYKSSAAKDEDGTVLGYRQAGDVPVTHMQKNRTFMMSPYNIGWCDPKKVLYLKRKNNMAFVQYMPDGTKVTGLTDNLPIIQQGSVIDYKIGNNVYFQWGRKDPMRGYFNRESTYKAVFGPRLPAMEGQAGKVIKDGIQKPNILFAGDGNASTNQDWLQNGGYKNLWNNHADVGTGSVNGETTASPYNTNIWCHIKTVYDPCPSGYMVPNAGVWNFITKTSAPNTAGAPNHHSASGNLNWFNGQLNGAYINSYNYKVYGNAPTAAQSNDIALFFASTGHRWFTNNWLPGTVTQAGDNFGSNVYYAWSNRWINAANAHCVALGLDTDDSSLAQGATPNYFIADHFIARKAMARPVRAIREP